MQKGRMKERRMILLYLPPIMYVWAGLATVSCILSNDRDIFGWANLRANLGLNNMYVEPPDLILNDDTQFIIWDIKFSENVPVPTCCALGGLVGSNSKEKCKTSLASILIHANFMMRNIR